MVTLDIPNDYTFSPALATPQLTINHDVVGDLDSSNAFEGPEKLLEVWFATSPSALPPTAKENGLKAVSHDSWVGMLDLVNCKILSVIHSETVDAYLLSESSMFVFPHKIILKTCGTTTLLLGLHRMLRIAALEAGFAFHNASSLDDIRAAATPYRVFYSRKNFLFPDKQQGPHRSWKQEVKYLDDMFEGGSAYMVGKMNGDHWYLYITSSPRLIASPPQSPRCESSPNGTPTKRSTKIPTGLVCPPTDAGCVEMNDETLEILMTDLDPENAKQFYLSHATDVARGNVVLKENKQTKDAKEVADANVAVLGTKKNGGRRLSDGSLSASATEEIFDVDDISMGSGGTLTPTSEHEAIMIEKCADGLAGMETTEGHALGTVVSDSCGLSDIYPASTYPDARIDAYMFSPCGFSANGVVPAPTSALPSAPSNDTDSVTSTTSNHHYFTVHVTPEPHCSYASFETNVPGGQKGRQTADIVKHVVDIFRPGRFSVTLFEAKNQGLAAQHDQYFLADDGVSKAGKVADKARLERIPGYRRIDRIVHDFEDYDLVFRYYEREGWVGDGEARVGEN